MNLYFRYTNTTEIDMGRGDNTNLKPNNFLYVSIISNYKNTILFCNNGNIGEYWLTVAELQGLKKP
jgi:hypothetical protein